MKKELMLLIKNDLAELKHNGMEIEDIEMYYNLEQNLVIKYKYQGEEYLITNELLCI